MRRSFAPLLVAAALGSGIGIVAFIVAFAALIGMRFAAPKSTELTVGLLGAFGLLIGVILDLAVRGQAARVPLSWTDPKVVSAGLMWLVFAVLLHARFRPAMRGRSVMWLTILAFAFLVFAFVGVDVFRLPTAHGRGRGAAAVAGSRRAS